MKPGEARRQALIRFGGVAQTRERTRDEFRALTIEHLARDIRFGARHAALPSCCAVGLDGQARSR